MRLLKIISLSFLVLLLVGVVWFVWYAHKHVPESISYGMSFNTMYARELGLDWQETYDAIVDELGVRKFRLAAHWPMTEPMRDVYNFAELDYQLAKAESVNAEVILAVGRRLPRWPECHVPEWARTLSTEEQQAEILEYMTVVVERYKDREVIVRWQLENEPYLEVFAKEHCDEFDEPFFLRQLEHLRQLDNSRPILVTDSGNLGLWSGPYRNGDLFGTSVYVYFWNPELGQFRTILPPWFYWLKEAFVQLRYGEKETILVELSAEPWLLEPVVDVPIETQFARMNLEKFNEILDYAERTRYEEQYLWGAEWWYWLMLQGHPEPWERGQQLFNE